MKQRLYKFHNTPLYFWLNPEDVASYNLFYEDYGSIPINTPFDDFRKATNVIAKIYGRIESAYERGLIPKELQIDRSEPLTLAY